MLLVDDGSRDGSAAWVAACAARDPRVRLLSLSRNFGHQLAITAGMDHADGDAVVIMDADLQDPPEVVPELAASLAGGPRDRLRGAHQPPRRVLDEAHPRRHLLQDVPSDGERGRAARRGRLPPRRPPGDRRAQAGARAAPLRARADLLGGLLAVGGPLRARAAPRRSHQVPGLEVDAARLGRDHVLLEHPAALDDRGRPRRVPGGSAPGGPRDRRPAPLPGVDGAGLGLAGRDHALPRGRAARLARPDRPVRRPHLRGEQEATALLRPERVGRFPAGPPEN